MQAKKRVSIADIARQLNISVTTVSFILNGKAREMRISDALIKKVETLIQQTNYQPNALAKSFRTGKTNTIGLLIEDISNPFFAQIARQIEDNAYKRGYRIFYASTENSIEKAREMIQLFADRHVDGYIITAPAGIEAEIKTLIEMKRPVVLFDRYFKGLQTSYVGVDNYTGTYDAVIHLLENGSRNIAFVTTDSAQSQMKDRLAGYKKALQEYGATAYVKKIPFDGQEGKEVTRHITAYLHSKSKVDAVFFATNYLLLRGLEALAVLGKKVGEEMRVVSFDDHEFFALFNPAITAVAQPVPEIASQLINLLLQELEQPDIQEKQFIQLPATLHVRASSVKKTHNAHVTN